MSEVKSVYVARLLTSFNIAEYKFCCFWLWCLTFFKLSHGELQISRWSAEGLFRIPVNGVSTLRGMDIDFVFWVHFTVLLWKKCLCPRHRKDALSWDFPTTSPGDYTLADWSTKAVLSILPGFSFPFLDHSLFFPFPVLLLLPI